MQIIIIRAIEKRLYFKSVPATHSATQKFRVGNWTQRFFFIVRLLSQCECDIMYVCESARAPARPPNKAAEKKEICEIVCFASFAYKTVAHLIYKKISWKVTNGRGYTDTIPCNICRMKRHINLFSFHFWWFCNVCAFCRIVFHLCTNKNSNRDFVRMPFRRSIAFKNHIPPSTRKMIFYMRRWILFLKIKRTNRTQKFSALTCHGKKHSLYLSNNWVLLSLARNIKLLLATFFYWSLPNFMCDRRIFDMMFKHRQFARSVNINFIVAFFPLSLSLSLFNSNESV